VKVTDGSPLADGKHKDRWIGNIGPDFEDALGVAEAKVHAEDTDGTTISFHIDCDTADECAGYQTQLVDQITNGACSTMDDGCDDGIFHEVSSADFVSGQTLSIKILGVADECTDDPRCTNDIAGIGFGQFFNPPQGSGRAAPPTSADGSMQACALWPQAAIDGLDDAMRELEPTIPPGGTPAQTLCPTTCKSKHCVGKHG
jgi:hypothetical protein